MTGKSSCICATKRYSILRRQLLHCPSRSGYSISWMSILKRLTARGKNLGSLSDMLVVFKGKVSDPTPVGGSPLEMGRCRGIFRAGSRLRSRLQSTRLLTSDLEYSSPLQWCSLYIVCDDVSCHVRPSASRFAAPASSLVSISGSASTPADPLPQQCAGLMGARSC